MEFKGFLNLLNTNKDLINDLEIEDYKGNTIAMLKDLDIADNEFGILRLQLNKKETK